MIGDTRNQVSINKSYSLFTPSFMDSTSLVLPLLSEAHMHPFLYVCKSVPWAEKVKPPSIVLITFQGESPMQHSNRSSKLLAINGAIARHRRNTRSARLLDVPGYLVTVTE